VIKKKEEHQKQLSNIETMLQEDNVLLQLKKSFNEKIA
jgi:hypothetical protein